MAEIKKEDTGSSMQEVPVRIVNQMVFVRNDVPVEDDVKDGHTFRTTYDYVPGTLVVSLNGLRQREGSDYDYVELGGNRFRFNQPILPDDVVVVDYIKIL